TTANRIAHRARSPRRILIVAPPAHFGAAPCRPPAQRARWGPRRRRLLAPSFAGSRAAPGQIDDEGAALAERADDPHRAAEAGDELARDPQAEAEAAGAAPRDRALEAAEDALVVLRVDADAVIAHHHLGAGAERAHRDLDRVAAAVLDRVAEQ